MKILNLYDSFFGNTEKIAEIINEELSKENDVDFKKIGSYSFSETDGYDLIVIGSPTRGFNCTKNILSFVKSLPDDSSNISFVVYDTNIDITKANSKLLSFFAGKFGYSNDTLNKILKKKKGKILAMEKFYVTGSEGPLANGEEERAKLFSSEILKIMERR